MNSFILALGRDCSWSPVEWMAGQGGVKLTNTQVTIEEDGDWLSILQDDIVINDFDENERKILWPLLGDPVMFLVEYKGERLVEFFIHSIPMECNAMIDNDHGLLVHVQQLRALSVKTWARASVLP